MFVCDFVCLFDCFFVCLLVHILIQACNLDLGKASTFSFHNYIVVFSPKAQFLYEGLLFC